MRKRLTENLQESPSLSIACCQATDLTEKLSLIRQLNVLNGQSFSITVGLYTDTVTVARVLIHLLHGQIAVGDPHPIPFMLPLRMMENKT